ncbi:hypothetical protein DPSP01_002532 [Paraphaeosphaeria sporulosa]
MMAFSACIGFGLFLHTGEVLNVAGPGLAVVAFLLATSVFWCVVSCLGEMTALFPVQGPLFEFPARYLDDAVGYAVGWMAWFSWAVTISNQALAVAAQWRFRVPASYLLQVRYPDAELGWGTESASPAVWVIITLLIVLGVNVLPVRWYGRAEYVFGCLKMGFICGLILFNVILATREGTRRGDSFWTWNHPYHYAAPNYTIHPTSPAPIVVTGDSGRALSLWAGVTTSFFAFTGFEIIALSAAENKDLETYETIKLGSRKLTLRLGLLYILATFTASLVVPYDDPMLQDTRTGHTLGGQHSVFIIAAVRAGLRGFPTFFNAFFIFSATTSAINGVYVSSRLLHALAGIPEAWPRPLHGIRRTLASTSAHGVPLAAVFYSWLFGLLAFLALRPLPGKVHARLVEFVTVQCLVCYGAICLSYTQFYGVLSRVVKDPGDVGISAEQRSAYDRDNTYYPYRTFGQRARAWYGVVFCGLLVVGNKWTAFIKPFDTADFLASYSVIAAYVLIIAAYHVRSDGWRLWKWRRHASLNIQRPPPKVVVPGRRRGRLHLPNPKHALWEADNMRAIGAWMWLWLK